MHEKDADAVQMDVDALPFLNLVLKGDTSIIVLWQTRARNLYPINYIYFLSAFYDFLFIGFFAIQFNVIQLASISLSTMLDYRVEMFFFMPHTYCFCPMSIRFDSQVKVSIA